MHALHKGRGRIRNPYLRLTVMMPDSTQAKRGSACRYSALQKMLTARTARTDVRTTPFVLRNIITAILVLTPSCPILYDPLVPDSCL